MSRITQTTVYKFDELSDRAKEKAREWYRQGALEYEWWEHVYEDAATCGKILGIDLNKKPVKLMNGSTRFDPSIWFQLSYSQGDGAAFDGTYSYAKGAKQAIREHAPDDTDLHDIAMRLQEAQSKHFYKLEAHIKSKGDTQLGDVEVFDGNGEYASFSAATEIADCMRDFATWIYDQLRKEYEYQMSDECVDESIRANEYEFTEEGELW